MSDHNNESQCSWCNQRFTPRRTGGHAQKFCSRTCRKALHAAAWFLAMEMIREGQITAADLKRAASTQALVQG